MPIQGDAFIVESFIVDNARANRRKGKFNMSDVIELSPAGEFVKSSGDARIYVRSWHPSHASRCAVVIVPGFNSHSGHYQWVAEQLNANGAVVYAVDLRGRGRSDGERFFVAKFSDYVDDVAAAVALAKSLEPGLPIFLLGHSAGGIVACFHALQHQEDLAGLICESFSYELPAPDFALAALKGLSHIMPHAHVVRLKNEDFSRDTAVVRAMNEDSLTIGEVQPTQTIAEMTRAGERLKGLFARITLPVLIVHGTGDKVAKPSGSQHFYAAAGSSDKTLKLYEGHFHDLLNDIGKDAVISDISLWSDSRLQHRSVAELARAASA